MNHLESITMNMSKDELVTVYTILYAIMRSDVLQRGAVLFLQSVCLCVCVN